MPNHAASVFKQLSALAEERGKDIGKFVQRGTTFEHKCAKIRIDQNSITYSIVLRTATGDEEQMGRFELTNKGQVTLLIKVLARSEKLHALKPKQAV